VSSYPVPDAAVPVSAGMIIALAETLITPPLKNGRDLAGSDVSALVAGGTARIRTGGRIVCLKVAGVTGAVVRRDGRVRAQGKPFGFARMGPWGTGWTPMPGRA
jgi:hypothetical protein